MLKNKIKPRSSPDKNYFWSKYVGFSYDSHLGLILLTPMPFIHQTWWICGEFGLLGLHLAHMRFASTVAEPEIAEIRPKSVCCQGKYPQRNKNGLCDSMLYTEETINNRCPQRFVIHISFNPN